MNADIVVIGSGPGGAAASRELSRRGFDVVVLEEGAHIKTPPHDAARAMSALYRDFGASVTRGRAPMPYLQGRALGGTSVINGAISWRLPRDVWESWGVNDPEFARVFPWEELEATTAAIEDDLNIRPTAPELAGPNNLLLAKGAEAIGLEHRPIWRNVRDCAGDGRCLQGCGRGAKQSMDRSYLLDAAAHGARLLTGARATRIVFEGGQASGVEFVTEGRRQTIDARAVVVAASAIQTPLLLLRSGARHKGVGRGFMAHPGASMAGRFEEPIEVWRGATQGHEVIGLRHEGLKFEALGFDLAVGASRFKSVGAALSKDIGDLGRWAHWGVAVKAQTEGRVRPTPWFGGSSKVSVAYDLTASDLRKVRRGVAVLGEMMLAAGASHVTPGVAGFDAEVYDIARMREFESIGSLDARDYAMVLTHMFSTCRMGSHTTNPVDLNFEVRGMPGVYVADSSVFPTNTGVNPQTSILAFSTLLGRRLGAASL